MLAAGVTPAEFMGRLFDKGDTAYSADNGLAAASCAIFLAPKFDCGVDDPVIGFKIFNPSIHYQFQVSRWLVRRCMRERVA